MFRWEWGMVRVALELVLTSVDMLGNNTPQTLLSNQKVIWLSNHFLVREADYRMWSKRCNVVWINEDHSFTGLKGGLRVGLGDGISHVIRLKPKAQMGLGITRPYKYVIVICEYLSNFFAFKTYVTFFFYSFQVYLFKIW